MLKFNEDNVCTLETDLIEMLGLDDRFIVSNVYYNPDNDKVFCCVRKMVNSKLVSLDGYTLEVETGSDGGLFTLQLVNDLDWVGDFPIHIATNYPGYGLQLLLK